MKLTTLAAATLAVLSGACGSVADESDAGQAASADASNNGGVDSAPGSWDASPGDPDATPANPDATVACTGSMAFGYTGSIDTFVVPACASVITIAANGGQGGGAGTQPGGLGASVQGAFAVTGGETLTILVGGQGIASFDQEQQSGGSGGGGSFVARADNSVVIVAGGGGGAIDNSAGLLKPGGPGQSVPNGQMGGMAGEAGGVNGGGGTSSTWGGWHGGAGGGGFLTNGVGVTSGNVTDFGTPHNPGQAFVNGGAGGLPGDGPNGRAGAFGGGGAAGFSGAGGGGYSGGGAGGIDDAAGTYAGGGGGSYNMGANPVNTEGANSGPGSVMITW